jgi:Fe-S cluster assembly protein SufD
VSANPANQPTDAKRVYLDAAAAMPATGWAGQLRAQALTHFDALGFPGPRDEQWKYTNVGPIARQAFGLVPPPAMLSHEQLEAAFLAGATSRLVFVHGLYRPEYSTPPRLPNAGFVGSLAEALRHPSVLDPYLGKIAPIEAHAFAALNTAFLSDGAYLRIPAGVTVEQPIHIVYFGGQSALAQPRTLIVAEEGSRATVIEHFIALDDNRYFTNAVTEVAVERSAVVEHYRLQQQGAQGYHIGGLYVRQERDSRFMSFGADLGGLLVRNDLRTLLNEGAECSLDGLYVVDGRQHVDNHTLIDHAAPRGVSRELYKGVLAGRARAVFNGKVLVRPNAQHIDAQQMNNNLLLSDDVEVDTKPEFEIYADDVKCGHGATVGQLDEDALFYLRSRAIEETAARDLLTYAFADDILRRFKIAPMRKNLEKILRARLLAGRDLKELDLV